MELEIDLYKVSYFVGKYGARTVKCITIYQMGAGGYRFANKVARKHKIDSKDVETVSNNLMNCLNFLE